MTESDKEALAVLDDQPEELRGAALEEIRRKVGCLYTWMLLITALALVGFLVACVLVGLNWGALLWTWP